MDRLHLKEVMHQLRAIRDATFEDVADAMPFRFREFKLNRYTNAVRTMSAEEIQRLEEGGNAKLLMRLSICWLMFQV